jgi:hypothetical protein
MSKDYFTFDELKCKCGCGLMNFSPIVKSILNNAREVAGIPFKISSACRCTKHNIVVGGSATSSHLIGEAVDIVVTSEKDRYKILTSLLVVGFRRIGIGKNFIHVDNDLSKPLDIIWLYEDK